MALNKYEKSGEHLFNNSCFRISVHVASTQEFKMLLQYCTYCETKFTCSEEIAPKLRIFLLLTGPLDKVSNVTPNTSSDLANKNILRIYHVSINFGDIPEDVIQVDKTTDVKRLLQCQIRKTCRKKCQA
jgi:hypothetical protein